MRSPGKATARQEVATPSPDPAWPRPPLLALAALLLLGLFSPPVADTDFWWHLKTGEYMAQSHSLPVPDPFAWTTAKVPLAYPAEVQTRRFNLTHEWLAQLMLYLVWRVGGFAGVVAGLAFSLPLGCAVGGLVCG